MNELVPFLYACSIVVLPLFSESVKVCKNSNCLKKLCRGCSFWAAVASAMAAAAALNNLVAMTERDRIELFLK